MMQEVSQLSLSDQPVQVVFQIPAAIDGVARLLVIFVIQILVTFREIAYHPTWPLKERFVLHFL